MGSLGADLHPSDPAPVLTSRMTTRWPASHYWVTVSASPGRLTASTRTTFSSCSSNLTSTSSGLRASTHLKGDSAMLLLLIAIDPEANSPVPRKQGSNNTGFCFQCMSMFVCGHKVYRDTCMHTYSDQRTTSAGCNVCFQFYIPGVLPSCISV